VNWCSPPHLRSSTGTGPTPCRCAALRLHVYRAFFGFLNGHVLNELQELVENPDETDDLLRLGLHRLPLSEFPLLRGLAHALACYDGAAELERGLDILIAGLAATLSLPGTGPPASPRTTRPAT
jgi:hypothetical protein